MARAAGMIPSLAPLSTGPTVLDASGQAASRLQGARNRTLVVIQLSGGNDGLNTLIPYSQQAYYTYRPTLGVPQDQVLKIDGSVGLHPSMTAISNLYAAGHAAVVQGAGYPNPNRSHFESMSIWWRAATDPNPSTGWLGRYLDYSKSLDASVSAVNVNSILPNSLVGEAQSAMAIDSLQNFRVFPLTSSPAPARDEATILEIDAVQCTSCKEYTALVKSIMDAGVSGIQASEMVRSAAASYQTSVAYPANDFGNRLKLAAQIITSSLKPRIIYLQIGGFDTHAAQKNTQATLLKVLSDGIGAFYQDMQQRGRDNDVLLMTFSEFGRRVVENGSQGTDHGTAEPMFVVGGNVKGGLYGQYPSLSSLDAGDLRYSVDFRQVYASVLDDWLGVDPAQILPTTFPKLSVF
jgi:uncharacterized protein (DUF1501 family)